MAGSECSAAASDAEQALDLAETRGQRVDVVPSRVALERRACRGGEVEALVERHRAVVARRAPRSPNRSSTCATSCGWMPGRLNGTTPPRSSAAGPYSSIARDLARQHLQRVGHELAARARAAGPCPGPAGSPPRRRARSAPRCPACPPRTSRGSRSTRSGGGGPRGSCRRRP